jgi:hypothetical protein
MQTGMLWFDNDRERRFEEKVLQAAARYQSKYGSFPTVCYVHPSMLLGNPAQVAGMIIRTTNMVLPHHFWLGHDEEAERRPAA